MNSSESIIRGPSSVPLGWYSMRSLVIIIMVLLSFSSVLALNQTVDLGLGAIAVEHVPGGGIGALHQQSFSVNRGRGIIVNAVTLDPSTDSNFAQQCQLEASNGAGSGYTFLARVDVDGITHRADFTNTTAPGWVGSPGDVDGQHVFADNTFFAISCFNQNGDPYNSTRYDTASYPRQSDYFAWTAEAGAGRLAGSAFRQIEINILGINATTAPATPFQVSFNRSFNYKTFQLVEASDNISTTGVGYAVACDIGGNRDIISYTFTPAFSFNNQTTIRTTVTNPNSYLTVSGWRVPMNVSIGDHIDLFMNAPNDPSFAADGLKLPSEHFNFVFNSSNSTPESYAFIFTESDGGVITDYLELTRQDDIVLVQVVNNGGTRTDLGNVSLTGGGVINMDVFWNQVTDQNSPDFFQPFFQRRVVINNQTLALGVTSQRSGRTIKSILFSSDILTSNGQLVIATVQHASLGVTTNLFPPQVDFVNQPSTGEIQTAYFKVIPFGVCGTGTFTQECATPNSTPSSFFSECDYSTLGTYTQRHYLGPYGQNNYTNFQDLIVVVNNNTAPGASCNAGASCQLPSDGGTGTCNGGPDCTTTQPGQIPPPATSDSFQQFINDILSSIGFTSQASKLIFWFIVCIGGAVAVYKWTSNNAIFGLLTFAVLFLAGIFFSLVPFWILILIVVLAGAAVAFGTRRAAAG